MEWTVVGTGNGCRATDVWTAVVEFQTLFCNRTNLKPLWMLPDF